MQRTIISLAVAWACQEIGRQYLTKQRIAEFSKNTPSAK